MLCIVCLTLSTLFQDSRIPIGMSMYMFHASQFAIIIKAVTLKLFKLNLQIEPLYKFLTDTTSPKFLHIVLTHCFL